MKLAATWMLLCALPALAEDEVRLREGEARSRASEARSICRGLLAHLDGVGSVNYGGAGTDYRLIVVVRDHGTQRKAREILRGDSCDGVRVLWSVSNPAASLPPLQAPPLPPAPPCPPAPPLATLPPATPTPPSAPPGIRPPRPLPPSSCGPSDLRRTFYAGPAALTPPRRYDGGPGYSNCSPSRYGLVAGGCPPRPCGRTGSNAGNISPGGCSRPANPRPAAVCGRPGRQNIRR